MFARMGLRSLILALLAFVVVLAVPVASQTDATQYVVRGSQTVNARSCARLSCTVVVTFEPGTELECSGTTQGDVVNGSDQWVQVAYEGDRVYVHSSLVKPEEQQAAEPADSETVVTNSDVDDLAEFFHSDLTISTARWTEQRMNGYSILVPSSWRTPEDLLGDDEYWGYMNTFYGKRAVAAQRESLQQIAGGVQSGQFDLALIDPFGSGTLVVVIRANTDRSIRYLQQTRNAYWTDILGADIVESEVISLPVGDSLHGVTSNGTGDSRFVADMYFVLTDDALLVIEVDMYADDAPSYLPLTRAVAESLVIDEDAKRW